MSLQFAVQAKEVGSKIAGLTKQQSVWCSAVANMYVRCKKRFSCPCRVGGGLVVCHSSRELLCAATELREWLDWLAKVLKRTRLGWRRAVACIQKMDS